MCYAEFGNSSKVVRTILVLTPLTVIAWCLFKTYKTSKKILEVVERIEKKISSCREIGTQVPIIDSPEVHCDCLSSDNCDHKEIVQPWSASTDIARNILRQHVSSRDKRSCLKGCKECRY